MDFVRLLISWKAYLLSPCTSERQGAHRVKFTLSIKSKVNQWQVEMNWILPLHCGFSVSEIQFFFYLKKKKIEVWHIYSSICVRPALLKHKQNATERQEVVTTAWTELCCHENNRTGEFYWKHHSVMDEIHPIYMIVFTSHPLSYRLDLAIVHNYYSIYCYEHSAKNGLISSTGSIAPDAAHLILVSRWSTAFIMLLAILSSIDDKAG